MKLLKFSILTVCAFIFAIQSSSNAAALRPASQPAKAESEQAATSTIVGEVVDLACYLDHGARGKKHAKCAASCAKHSVPLGILTKDGKLYLATQHHSPAKKLIEHAAHHVEVQGKIVTRNGISMIEVETVKHLSAAK